ncbi:hypothetical protein YASMINEVIRUS_944 [Yasminevirus sp. GU-2018]|uniref:Kinesin motor domain-containing protein n=1 Tax=Yasminevirus sp. GU-2018 TaxID=2420051 RepID=A0A5K0UA56_9VIRU|nr:hypothetical protein YASMINEVIRUS_944 [Yasminevirus sp. GU-2018]
MDLVSDQDNAHIDMIKRECIKDHRDYIKSYVQHNGGREIHTNYRDGVKRYNDIKALMRDITLYHPTLMAFLLNPKESGLCTDQVCSAMINEGVTINSRTEGGLQFGGTRQQVSQTIEKVKSLFESLKTTDTDKIKETTDKLVQKLDSIDKRLESVVTNNGTVDTEKVLNNMVAVVDNLERFDPASKSYRKMTSAYDIYTPTKKFKGVDMKEISTLSNVSGEMIASYLDLLAVPDTVKKLINAVFSSDDSDQLTSQLRALYSSTSDVNIKRVISDIISKVDIESSSKNTKNMFKIKPVVVVEYVLPLLRTMKTELDPGKVARIDASYGKMIDDITAKKVEIDTLTDKLNKSASDTVDYMYGDNDERRREFAKIRSNILPKLREIISLVELYSSTIKSSDADFLPTKTLIDSYKKITISEKPYHQADMGLVTTKIMTHLDNYKLELTREAPDNRVLMNELTEFVQQCEEADMTRKISIYNEKTTSLEVGAFIEQYNSVVGESELSDHINIFMAEMYRNLLVKITKYAEAPVDTPLQKLAEQFGISNELLQRHVNIVRELNVKKVRDLVSHSTLDEFSKTRPVFDTLLAKVYGYDPKSNLSKSVVQILKESKTLMKHLKDKITTEKEARNFVHAYNISVYNLDLTALMSLGLPSDIKLIPRVYFLRDYTDRVYNNIFKDINEHRQQKANILGELVDESLKSSIDTPDEIYSPDFKRIKMMMDAEKRDSLKGGLLKKGSQKGGTIETIVKRVEGLAKLKLEYAESVKLYLDASDKYVMAYNDVYSYTRYLILIATNQFFTENYVVYKYLNKGLIELYKRITTRMVRDLDSGVTEPHIVYVRKYYNVVVRRLDVFLNKLSFFMRDPTELIDIKNIDSSSNEIRNDMILLNYFKPIIESYNEMFQNQITIYARLNDIVGEIDYQSKVFVSDHEKFKNSGCGYQVLTKNMEPDLALDLCAPAKTADVDMGGDATVMWSRQDACKPLKLPLELPQKRVNVGETLFPNEKPMIFTEVFDSVNFPENSDISKYMTLETQLAKKKGVCVLTYGYSGTGKTYTLFGNSNKQGVLQSTLVNINGLYKVKFRLFEIYGRGLPYDFYWNSPDKTSRINDIDHTIFHYVLENTGTNIQVQNTEDDLIAVKPKHFLPYIENNIRIGSSSNTYISVPKKDIKNVFGNFSTFTESIDKYRKGESGRSHIKNTLRIRETPNNPESSRSILVYDFKLYVGDESGSSAGPDGDNELDAVRFLIVDLPGREEISQTYIEPYLGNPVIKSMLDSGEKIDVTFTKNGEPTSVDPTVERVRMIITCMALNPMALAVFQPHIVVNTVNSLDKTVRNVVYGDSNGKGDITNEYEINQIGTKLNFLVKLTQDLKLEVVPPTDKRRNNTYGFGYETDYQCLGVGAVYVIYRLIEKSRFDIIEDIYRKIVDVEINKTLNDKIDSLDKTTGSSTELFSTLRGLIESKFKGERTAKTVRNLIEVIIGVSPKKGMTTLGYVDGVRQQLESLRSSVPEEHKKIDEIKASLKLILKYDYLMTPLEGIYINENIIGLIKYLSSRLIKDKTAIADIEVLNRTKVKQREMILSEQRNIARCWLMSKDEQYMTKVLEKSRSTRLEYMTKTLFNFEKTYNKSYFSWVPQEKAERTYFNNMYSGVMAYVPISDSSSSSDVSSQKHLVFITEQIVKQQRQLISVYASDKIYNFDKPLITDILAPYIESDETPTDQISVGAKSSAKQNAEPMSRVDIRNKTAIKDYKLFYLFGNYDDDQKTQFKCEHQLKLLKNTENFVKAIAN